MRHHRRICATIFAGALLTLFAACQDPDPYGTLDRLIEQPSNASDVAKAVHRAYRNNAALYALEYRNQPLTVYGVMRQRGEDWAMIYHKSSVSYRTRCKFSDHVRDLASASMNQEVVFSGELLHTEGYILTLTNCRSPNRHSHHRKG